MKILILLLALSGLSESHPYHGVTVGFTPYSAPVNSHSQYHSQDVYGNYAYGYASDLSSKDEVKTPDGVTRGGYSYIDANGILQTVQYVSDPVHGFRVVATNLPRDLPEVEQARAQHLAQFEYIKAEHAQIASRRSHGYVPAVISPVPAPGAYVAPIKGVIVTPSVLPAPAVPIAYAPAVVALSSQYHDQDGLGQYSYGYSDPLSAKSETKSADGVTRGGYSYIDANGILQTVQYVSDPVHGFRVAATNLPVAPSVTLIGPKVTTSVVGPKDNNVDVITALPPTSNPVTLPPVDTISSQPIPIDSNVGQDAVIPQAEIVQNANIPINNPEPIFIYPNPNQETPLVIASHELSSPFSPQTVVQTSNVPIAANNNQAEQTYRQSYVPKYIPYTPSTPDTSYNIPENSNYPSETLLPPKQHVPISNYQGYGNHQIYTEPTQQSNLPSLEQAAPSLTRDPSYNRPIGVSAYPINADTINNNPINQQALNHQASNGADEGRVAVPLFTPQSVQQVYGFRAPVDDATVAEVPQVPPQRQIFLVQALEQDPTDVQPPTNKNSNSPSISSPGTATAPNGYYSHNIQY